MPQKITIGLSRNPRTSGDRRAYRIDQTITPQHFDQMTHDERLVFIQIGMDLIELPESVFRRLCAAVDTAYHAGMSYPEDAKRLHGLDDGDVR